MNRLFITGTDTGVGKTTVACAIVAAWRTLGRRLAVMKPIETGCSPTASGLLPEDARRLCSAAGDALSLADVCPCRFALPASPEAAAEAASATIDRHRIAATAARILDRRDALVVEGAGGLLVPISPGYLMADLALDLDCALLIVARASLGTINHTLLTIEAARRRNLPLLGVVLNRPSATNGPDEPTNPAAIMRYGQARIFGTFPHLPESQPTTALAEAAERSLDLQGLWDALQAISPTPRT